MLNQTERRTAGQGNERKRERRTQHNRYERGENRFGEEILVQENKIRDRLFLSFPCSQFVLFISFIAAFLVVFV
jgi:hypothetical protein